MSKQRNTTQRSKQTEEEIAAQEEPQIDLTEFENVLLSFNTEQTKHDICREIKNLETLIQEETTKESAGDGADEPAETKV